MRCTCLFRWLFRAFDCKVPRAESLSASPLARTTGPDNHETSMSPPIHELAPARCVRNSGNRSLNVIFCNFARFDLFYIPAMFAEFDMAI